MRANNQVTQTTLLANSQKTPWFDAEAYSRSLNPNHIALAPLGLSAAALQAWGAGYSTSGINRGRLAVPVFGNGVVAGYFGLTIMGAGADLSLPAGLLPARYIFGSERVKMGALLLARSPIEVIRAYERGHRNVVSFLTAELTPTQMSLLQSLMRQNCCGILGLVG